MTSNQSCTPIKESIFQEFPTFEIVPIHKVIPHELHDPSRTPPLINNLRKSGVMINPPLFSPFDDNSGNYMVLDGANRTFAFQEMGFPHILAQVIPSDSPELQLSTWNHVIWDTATSVLLKSLGGIPDSFLVEIEDKNEIIDEKCIVASIQAPDDRKYIITTNEEDKISCVSMMKNIMAIYKASARFDRISLGTIESIQGLYDDISAIISYPHFEIQEVFDLCKMDILLPSGITRFRITPRALKINYPLDELANEKSLQDKKKTLNAWLQNKLANKGARFYEESTLIFDE